MTVALRSGYTTGACASAAAKAAALALRGEECQAVDILLPDGAMVALPIEWVHLISSTVARAAVRKVAGDDPDVTDGMTVVAEVELTGDKVTFRAGEGVGTITLPGLQLPPGEPAINPVPRRMIAAAVAKVLGAAGCTVTVSIPGGAEMAPKTFNPRLGIEGGLSILGTSGRVMPKSEEAWLRSLLPQIDVALAAGERVIYLAPGGFGERAAQEQLQAPLVAIAQTSNFIGDMLRACAERGVERAVLVGHVGKLVKVAAGIFNTHSRFGDARLETVAALAAAEGAPGPLVARLLDLPTCEAAVPLLAEAGFSVVWDAVARRAAHRAAAHAGIPVNCVLTDYTGTIIGADLESEALYFGQWVPGQARSLRSQEIVVVGVGPGPAGFLTPAAWQAIRQAEVLVGGRRQLEQFASPDVEQVVIAADIAAVMIAIRQRLDRKIVVLASGDPACYGIMATLKRELGDIALEVIPGISSMQLALARLGESWEGVVFASAHGREMAQVVAAVQNSPRVLALTDHQHPAQTLAQALLASGCERNVVVLERLGYPDEQITRGALAEVACGAFDPLAVVWIEKG